MISKPKISVVLLIIGGMFYTFGSIFVGLQANTAIGSSRTPGVSVVGEPNWAAIATLATGVICSVAILAGSLLIYTGVRSKARIGSFVSILFSIVGFSSTYGGLLIGLALVVIGNVLVLVQRRGRAHSST